jgi:hypothetical protein
MNYIIFVNMNHDRKCSWPFITYLKIEYNLNAKPNGLWAAGNYESEFMDWDVNDII